MLFRKAATFRKNSRNAQPWTEREVTKAYEDNRRTRVRIQSPLMNMTVQEHNDQLRRAFRQLSLSRRRKLVSDAKGFIYRNPGAADHSNFWRGLSARQVIAANVRHGN